MSKNSQSKPPSKLPEVRKTLTCPTCKKNSSHHLQPHRQGAAFFCLTCNHLTQSFTIEQMAATVMKKVFKLPNNPAPRKVPPGLKVYLEHHGTEAIEMEASPQSVKNHIELTGQIPTVGKPLYAPVAGQRAFALPYGKVVRVTLP